MTRILLVEDDPILGKGLSMTLKSAGYDVFCEPSLQAARARESLSQFDLVILDVNLPDGSGFDFAKELRVRGSRLPIIMLTARTDEDSVVTGIEAGANDYIKKPFSNKELLVRIRSQLKVPFQREDQIRNGPVLILLSQRKVMVNNLEVEFNRREFDIFVHMVKHAGTVQSRDQVLTAVEIDDSILDRTIDSHFSHIRSKLRKKEIANVIIRSVYGLGYKLEFFDVKSAD